MDTARQRADSQFNTCLYVYDSEERLRECLVLRFQWPTPEAARRIAIYTAEMRRIADSIAAEVHREDSLRRAELDREQAAREAQQRREAVAARAAAAAAEKAAAAAAYWGQRTTKLYHTNTPNCATVTRMSREDRVVFESAEAAERAGYERSLELGC